MEAFIESLGLRPLDVGGLKMAHWLEGAGVVTVGLANHGMGNLDFALSVTDFPSEQTVNPVSWDSEKPQQLPLLRGGPDTT